MTTEKYVKLMGVSRATAWRELDELQTRQLLVRSGQGRGTRYALNFEVKPVTGGTGDD